MPAVCPTGQGGAYRGQKQWPGSWPRGGGVRRVSPRRGREILTVAVSGLSPCAEYRAPYPLPWRRCPGTGALTSLFRSPPTLRGPLWTVLQLWAGPGCWAHLPDRVGGSLTALLPGQGEQTRLREKWSLGLPQLLSAPCGPSSPSLALSPMHSPLATCPGVPASPDSSPDLKRPVSQPLPTCPT